MLKILSCPWLGSMKWWGSGHHVTNRNSGGKMFENRDAPWTQGDNEWFLKLNSQPKEFKTYVRDLFIMADSDIPLWVWWAEILVFTGCLINMYIPLFLHMDINHMAKYLKGILVGSLHKTEDSEDSCFNTCPITCETMVVRKSLFSQRFRFIPIEADGIVL